MEDLVQYGSHLRQVGGAVRRGWCPDGDEDDVERRPPVAFGDGPGEAEPAGGLCGRQLLRQPWFEDRRPSRLQDAQPVRILFDPGDVMPLMGQGDRSGQAHISLSYDRDSHPKSAPSVLLI